VTPGVVFALVAKYFRQTSDSGIPDQRVLRGARSVPRVYEDNEIRVGLLNKYDKNTRDGTSWFL